MALSPLRLDHVALWVGDRDRIAAFASAHLGMHEIERTDAFTLVGSDARRFKLTLFAADGPRDPGPLQLVALRVSDLAAAEAALPDGALELERSTEGEISLAVAEGLRIGLVEAPTPVEYDLDHVQLVVPDPERSADAWHLLGLHPTRPSRGAVRVGIAGAYLELWRGESAEPERPLLNHLAVLVDSADAVIADAGEQQIEVESVVDAENTYAAFLWGPERVRIEYVEHKPTFSLT